MAILGSGTWGSHSTKPGLGCFFFFFFGGSDYRGQRCISNHQICWMVLQHLQFPPPLISQLSRFKRSFFFFNVYTLYVCICMCDMQYDTSCVRKLIRTQLAMCWNFISSIDFSLWVFILKCDLLFFSFLVGEGGLTVEMLMQRKMKWILSCLLYWFYKIKIHFFPRGLDTVLSHMLRPGPCTFMQLLSFDEKGNLWVCVFNCSRTIWLWFFGHIVEAQKITL